MIKFTPRLSSLLWERKSQIAFNNVNDMKNYVADQHTKFSNYTGKCKSYNADDVELKPGKDYTNVCKEFFAILVDGIVVGHCGE